MNTATESGTRTLTGRSMVEGVRSTPRTIRRAGGLFRLLVGIHFGDGPVGCRCEDCEKDELYLPDKAEQVEQLQAAVDTCKDVAEKQELIARLKWVLSRRDRARNHVYRARRVSPLRDAAGMVHAPDPIGYTGDLIESPNYNLETQNQPGSYKFERVHEGNTPSMLGPITAEELARRGYSGPVTGSLPVDSFQVTHDNVTPPAHPPVQGVQVPPSAPNPIAKATNGTDSAKAARSPAALDSLSTQGLRDLADAEEIDISKCKNREETLKTVKSALGAK